MEPTKEFSKTVLTLDNCIIPRCRLLNTPSQQDGVSRELEVDLRLVGCEYIQTAGLLLKLPQVSPGVSPFTQAHHAPRKHDVISSLSWSIHTALCVSTGRYGYSSSALPQVLLLEVICKVQSSGKETVCVKKSLFLTPSLLASLPLPPSPCPSSLSGNGNGVCVRSGQN